MARLWISVASAGFLVLGSGWSAAQHHHGSHDHRADAPTDARVFVRFPDDLVEHTLANMRDHLAALQEIQEALSRDESDKAAQIAETRLGMSSLGAHGAHEVARYMPQGMQDAGSQMHRAASRFALAAQNAGVTGDFKPALAELARVTAQCVGCHAGYRLK